MIPAPATVALLFLLAAASCASGDAVAARPYNTTFDTVGETTFARTTGEVPESMVRKLVVEWRAGAADSIDSLSVGDVSEIAVAPDGRVWVWDHVTPALWTLDANGSAMRRVSGRGNGPGEYVRVNGIAADKNGRVVMWDEGNTRLNFYKADGTFETSTTLPFNECCPGSAVTLDLRNRIWLAGHIMPGAGKGPDGLKGAMMKAMIGGEREVVAFFVFDSAGSLLDTVRAPAFPGENPVVRAVSATAKGVAARSMMVPYTAFAVNDVSPLGYLVTGTRSPYSISAESNGKPLRITRDYTPVPIAEDERSQHRANLEFNMRQVVPSWTWNGPEIPSEKPPYTSISVGLDGRIWVALSVESEQFEPDAPRETDKNRAPPVKYRAKEKRWDVFEPDGRYVGRVVAPRQFVPYVMRGENVWGVLRDEDDVPSVVRMRIEPPTT